MFTKPNDHLGHQRQTYLSIALCIILVCLTFIINGVHKQSHTAYEPHKKVQWQQYFELENSVETISKPIGNQEWAFEFNGIINILSRITVDSNNNILISSETLDVLKRASSQIPKKVPSSDIKRLGVVIEKSFSGIRGEQIRDLFNKYYLYRQEASSLLMNINSAVDDKKQALLKAYSGNSLQIQIHFFGKPTAEKLFAKQNKTQNYINKRRQINVSSKLSDDQKNTRLRLLQKAYQQSLAE